jgi:soluble lytic murein transglycosylase-like protein
MNKSYLPLTILIALLVIVCVIGGVKLGKCLEQKTKHMKLLQTTIKKETARCMTSNEAACKQSEIHNSIELKAITAYIRKQNNKVPKETAALIAKYIIDSEIDIPILVGLIQTESSFNPSAVSCAGAIGLMQVMYSVWGDKFKIKSISCLFNIEDNINYGVRILNHYLKQHNGNYIKALNAYNGVLLKGGFANKVVLKAAEYVAFRTSNKVKKGES